MQLCALTWLSDDRPRGVAEYALPPVVVPVDGRAVNGRILFTRP